MLRVTKYGAWKEFSKIMGIQIFGTVKCKETRKAQRYFKDRGITFQFIDLAEKVLS